MALGCMALFSPKASACTLTTVFNISGHGLSILRSGSVVLHSSPEWTSVQCVLFSYSFKFMSIFSGFTWGEHGCMVLFSSLAFAYALTMVFNISGHYLQCFRVALICMACFVSKMDYCAMCHVWVFLQAILFVLFMVFLQVRMRRLYWRCITIRLQDTLMRKNSLTLQKSFYFWPKMYQIVILTLAVVKWMSWHLLISGFLLWHWPWSSISLDVVFNT